MRNKLMLAAAAAALTVAASPAYAAITIDAGTTVTTSGPVGSDIDFSIGLSDSGANSPFVEVLKFSNTLAGTYNFVVGSSSADVNLTDVYVTGTGIVGSISISKLFDVGAIESWGKEGVALGAGSFDFTIEGVRKAGSFGGSVAFSAVPEPSTWAMMILGMGVLGASLRRRQRQTVNYNFA